MGKIRSTADSARKQSKKYFTKNVVGFLYDSLLTYMESETDEYFETVEYEGHAPLGSRDILGKLPGRSNFHSLNSMDFP